MKHLKAVCETVVKQSGKGIPMRPKTKETLLYLAFSSLVFLALYRRFVFGQAVYLYTDIGSDSVASSYPILVMLSRLFRAGDFSFYTLSSGLGADTAATFLQYLNPLKGFLLFFDRSNMTAGLLLQLYLDTVICCFASWRYFRLLTGHQAASMVAGLLFSFSGYAVLWSQNLSFGVCFTMFALTMLALEAFLQKKSLLRFLALIGVLAVYVFTNYFFCYMTALFVILYIPVRSLLVKDRPGLFLKGFFSTGLAAVCALLMAAVAVAAVAGNFLGSVRTGDASRSFTGLLKIAVDVRVAFACAARLFSENMTGIGDAYTGPDNYYEIAVLFMSALFLFSLFYHLYVRKTRLTALLLLAGCALALLVPVLRYILNMNPLVMRFSFWITLLEGISIAFFLKDVFTGARDGALLFSALATVLFTALMFGLFFLLAGRLDFTLSARTVLFSSAATLACAVLLLLSCRRLLPSRALPLVFLLFAAGEILLMHHDTLYLRLYVRKSSSGNPAYSDATYELVNGIKASDPELCRIASTENYFYANEGLVDDFNATTLYNNTNPASLSSLALSHGTNEVNTPYFMTGYSRYYQFTLLAGRYLLRREAPGESFTESALFEKVASAPSGVGDLLTTVYKNKNALPFGYLLKQQIPEKDYLDSDLMTRMQLLTRCWYLTGESAGTADGSAEEAGRKDGADASTAAREAAGSDVRHDLVTGAVWRDPHNLEVEQTPDGLKLIPTGEDPYIYVYFDPAGETDLTSRYLYLSTDADTKENRSFALYFLADKDAQPSADWVETIAYNKYYPAYLSLMPDHIAGFRFDPDDGTESVTLHAMELIECTDPLSHFSEIAATDIRDASFSHDTYTAEVRSDGEAMLCVPLLYTKGWRAEVNGREEPVYNINGGLAGVRVGKGTARVTLRYSIPGFKGGLIVTTAALVLYLAALMFALLREKRGNL